ncbi:MAG: DUF4976 domain-containing protein, partial [Planctomycetaceae bacterium]|nr:DUF4976 domain-containing protein [Planctomycetaceae bacterium]
THIPFLVVAPGVTTAESRCDQPVDLTTVYPTLLELCDLPADPECEGISLVPLLKNPNAEWSQPALMTWLQGNHAVRSKNWRFIQYRDGTEELYDCRQDPHEETNLASDPANQQILKELRQYLPEKNMAQVTDMKKPKE